MPWEDTDGASKDWTDKDVERIAAAMSPAGYHVMTYQQIRIEALGMALASFGMIVGHASGGGATVNIADGIERPGEGEILERAKRFERYLESGE